MLLLVAGVAAGCASSGQRAPVVERSQVARKPPVIAGKSREEDVPPGVHVVQKGETLYSIAFSYGLDYHELAAINGIENPNVISVGQELRLASGATTAARPGVGAESMRANDVPPAPVVAEHPVAGVAESERPEPLLKEQPKVVKYPYSETAVAQIEQGSYAASTAASSTAVAAADKVASGTGSQSVAAAAENGEGTAELEWIMPTSGRLISQFSEASNQKGIDIAGKLGQPILASASGKVVYSGRGLRGYGKLVIIKHNSDFLSAYAHNDKILVQEGQLVKQGQKIAEMGNTDADRVKLHFEVRYHGKPVDPAQYLPLD